MRPIDNAVAYAALGWKVHPCIERAADASKLKAPYLARGFHDASRDVEQVAAWWQRWPDALIGLAVPPNSIVLDIDPRDGGTVEALEQLADAPLPETLIAESGGDDRGRHYWFRAETTGLRHNGLPKGIDLREGGRAYVIAPPSIHPLSGRPYRWLHRAEVAIVPAGIMAALKPKPLPAVQGTYTPGTDSPRALDGLLRRMGETVEGERNAVLFWCAARMADREQRGLITDWTTLAGIAEQRGLTAGEIVKTIDSARRTAGVSS